MLRVIRLKLDIVQAQSGRFFSAAIQRAMTSKTPPRPTQAQGSSRDDRLKAALKANLARRKAQARSRKAAQTTDTDTPSGNTKNTDKE
ncbi:hypothetical protein SAMN05216236_14315 [Sedimentitalea nanhaiensis]|uniref:Uncharacterized protein n=2 Tax=Sedimentitalea nanhaiensis TaxID=999627 RepID=A0A1I7E3U3_9RHOB|nr:hypothetical protein SAMN05216236_14315 [Sedimentitalea nanhaiensis]